MRRKRQSAWSRDLVRETRLTVADLVLTTVITDSESAEGPVPSLPGVARLGLDALVAQAREAASLGIPAIALFPHIDPSKKDGSASEALNADGLVPNAIRRLKAEVPEIGVIVDVALDPFTDHGHDGLMQGDVIDNDSTLDILARGAVILAEAGADIVAPSDMMDGRIGIVRDALDEAGHPDVMILSYAAKYASAFYGPYRDAIGTASALRGDKRTYQMDPANTEEALHEVAMDLNEGADMVMVKPGLPYLDICHRIKTEFGVPTFAFQVSGEYAMIQSAGENGWADSDRLLLETLTAFRRAGCDAVLTYGAIRAAKLLKS
ncbi:delta-aminolevulinic acid dehydratase [Algimonas ampicilliniresistens]|uniref:Delta-aminolevulinic acid dehydratase n=2 Tax=Algimonas ampicilliniresistens TaxID=1298735 RepID=A0ABQ5V8U5_9PROT|nr:delta-aminolevulinic acid dehydratase [Algimonas ampicilliniresistens]